MEMIVEGGLDALSVNQLAKRLDFTPGALYRYFDSKETLLSVLTTEVLETVRAKLAQAANVMARDDGVGRVYAIAAAYRAFTRQAPHRFGMLAMMLAEPRTVFRRDESAKPAMDAMIAALGPLAEALAMAGVERAAHRATTLFAGLQGVLTLHKQSRRAPHVFPVDALAEEMVRTLLLGWGVTSADLDDAATRMETLGPINHYIGDWS
jgi:AcrR family transcriptional regulator